MSAEGLLQAIVEHPDDDVSRLVYADWLEDSGQPARAEFIRVQCALAKTDEGAPEYLDLLDREQDLLAAHGEAWRSELPNLPGVRWGHWQRGFVEEVRSDDFEAFFAQADRIFAVPTIRRLRFAEQHSSEPPIPQRLGPGGGERLAALPHMERIDSLDLWCQSIGPQGAAALARSRYLTKLAHLDLTGNAIEDEGVRALAASPHLGALRRLSLETNHLTPAVIKALGDAGWRKQLQSLDLSENDELASDVIALLREVTHPSLTRGNARFHPPGAFALLTEVSFPCLTSLRLKNVHIGPALGEILAGLDAPHLQALDLDGAYMTASGTARLLASELGRRLRSLSLRNNCLGPEGARVVAAAQLPQLADLNLQGNSLGPAGAEALASASGMPALSTLGLFWNRLGASGAAELATSPLLANLTRLNLGMNGALEGGVKALAESPHLSRLVYLNLEDCIAGDLAISALLRSGRQDEKKTRNRIEKKV
jgi:uncharacterized protein (TIGR02996 family)